jgi:hypothetical protein
MTTLLSNARATVLLYKMQMAWFFLFSFNALCTSALSVLSGNDWANTDNQTRLMILIGVAGSWTNTIMALFSKAMSRVQEGESPFVEPPSVTTRKTVTAEISTTTQTTPQP